MAKHSTAQALAQRPRPPVELVSIDGALAARFVPAPDLVAWISTLFLTEDGLLFDTEHMHLNSAFIGCLWTTAPNSRQMRRIVGQAEMPAQGGNNSWSRARAEQQLREWFGRLPDFLLTFDALYANEIDDASFCALVDHELRHCAQALDQYGAPKFNRATGLPVFAMRGHDIEEFVAVVRRFGVAAAGEAAQRFVDAALLEPEIAPAQIAQACGTCLARAA